MRIVHLSDIHLSASNFEKLNNYYLDILIDDLKNYHKSKTIEIIVISGDLVDKGGRSLIEIEPFKSRGVKNPFLIFQEVFIDPICDSLNLKKDKVLFVPGNHDLDEGTIKLVEERNILGKINPDNSSSFLAENNIQFTHSKRVREFKEFEETYHAKNDDYDYTNNESTFFYQANDGQKIGFILMNDSWRCKSVKLLDEKQPFKHIVGCQQIYNASSNLDFRNPDFTLCVMHHSLKDFKDEHEIDKALKHKNISAVLNGHYHSNDIIPPTNGSDYLTLRCRASFNSPNEKHVEYIPGYQILDIESGFLSRIHYRIYSDKYNRFSPDTVNTIAQNGVDETGYTLRDPREMSSHDINKFM
jgi:Icc-related predicted phosphoesterase